MDQQYSWKRFLGNLGLFLTGGLLTALAGGIVYLNSKPDLKIWHRANLDAEFTLKSRVNTFDEYVELEETLFTQLQERVYRQINPEERIQFNRFFKGSLSDPTKLEVNWNKSFEWKGNPSHPSRPAVLLLHGLSDSPYSLRSFAEGLHAEGAHVLGLRIPGHGTAPSALTRTSWQDMGAAVTMAVKHLAKTAPERPLHIIGYSNGGALAVNYALSTMKDPELPKLAGMILLSPEIGITPMAALAIWQERIGNLLGLHKLKWTAVVPEYDPYKYTSFPANAGNLAHELTKANREEIARLGEAGKLQEFPSILAFQSVLDATITAPSLFKDLLEWLPEDHHEVVLFDLNRNLEIDHFLKEDPLPKLKDLMRSRSLTFSYSILTNSEGSDELIERRHPAGSSEPLEVATGLKWPPHIYSLSHVALPFPPEDPVYGGIPEVGGPGIKVGLDAVWGEKGALQVPVQDMLRLRWNPFHPYLEKAVLNRLGLAGEN